MRYMYIYYWMREKGRVVVVGRLNQFTVCGLIMLLLCLQAYIFLFYKNHKMKN